MNHTATARRRRAAAPAAALALAGALAAAATLGGPAAGAAPAPSAMPTVALGTFLGGRSEEAIADVAVDASGIYVVGTTYSDDIPGIAGARQGWTDMFVAKLNPAGTALLWGRYLGGGDDEEGRAIALDGKGGVWVTGSSESDNFPVTAGAFQPDFAGGADMVAVKLDAGSGQTLYSTYYGGARFDQGNDIGADPVGNIYVAGVGEEQVMVFQIEPSLKVGYHGLFGGRGEDEALGLAVHRDGFLYLTGSTRGVGTSNDFPIIEGFQGQCGRATAAGSCGEDAFVAVLSPEGEVIYGTLLGGSFNGSATGSGGDEGRSIALDAESNIYVAGLTFASDFPTRDAAQAAKAGADTVPDGFLTKVSADGKHILFSTYLGGAQWDELRGVRVDAHGSPTVVGMSGSQDFPLKDARQASLGSGVCGLGGSERWCYDAVVARLSPAGALTWSSYLGGGADDMGGALAIGADGSVYLAGASDSRADQGFPVTAGALQPAKGLRQDGFVVRLAPPPSDPDKEVTPQPSPQPTPDPRQNQRLYIPLVVR